MVTSGLLHEWLHGHHDLCLLRAYYSLILRFTDTSRYSQQYKYRLDNEAYIGIYAK